MIKRQVGILLSLPKTLWFNLKCFNIKMALKLPVFIHYKVRVIGKLHKNFICLEAPLSMAMVKIGFPHLTYPAHTSIIKGGGKLTFKGTASVLTGCEFNVSGNMVIGNNFRCNPNTKLDCKKYVVIGNDVIFGPECYLSDDDGHKIYNNEDSQMNLPEDIIFGDHIWVGRGAYILKGTVLQSETVVGARSVVNRKFYDNNIVIAGTPGKVVKTGISWEM